MARAFRIPAEVFSIGFGREIVGWTDRQGTRWKVGWLPLGGYVRFIGDMSPASNPAEAHEVPPELRDRAFQLRPVWQRFLVVLAGPVANFILAVVIIASFIAIYGATSTPNVVTGTVPHSAARAAGLQVGDRVVSIAGRSTPTFEEISQLAALYPEQDVSLGIERNNQLFHLNVHIGTQVVKDRFGQSYRIGLLGIPVPPKRFEKVPAAQIVPLAVERVAFLTQSMFSSRSARRSSRSSRRPALVAARLSSCRRTARLRTTMRST